MRVNLPFCEYYTGDLPPNHGSIATPNEITIGYLKQDLDFEDGRTVQEEAEQAFHAVKKIEQEIELLT